MLTLVERADVFVTNIRPGGLQRLGMDSTSLLERNPRLIYGHFTGYGAEGPYHGHAVVTSTTLVTVRCCRRLGRHR